MLSTRKFFLVATSPLRLVHPRSWFATAVDAFRDRYAEHGVTLTSDVEPGLPALWADAERLGQVRAYRQTRLGADVPKVAALRSHVTTGPPP